MASRAALEAGAPGGDFGFWDFFWGRCRWNSGSELSEIWGEFRRFLSLKIPQSSVCVQPQFWCLLRWFLIKNSKFWWNFGFLGGIGELWERSRFWGRASNFPGISPNLGLNFPGFFLLVAKFKDPPGFVLIWAVWSSHNSQKFPQIPPNSQKFPQFVLWPGCEIWCISIYFNFFHLFSFFPHFSHWFSLIFIDFHPFFFKFHPKIPPDRAHLRPRGSAQRRFWVFGAAANPKIHLRARGFLISGV